MKLPAIAETLIAWPQCLFLGTGLRLLLLVFGSIQDSLSTVRYTDIDYDVYSDAAAFVSAGKSPYLRATFRYTPLLAWALTPTVVFHSFGKLLFVLADILLALLMRRLMILRGLTAHQATRYGALPILLNPLILNLSTRGNADILIVLLVIVCLEALLRGRVKHAACIYGLAVHVKIYPIIYAPAIILFLNSDYPCSDTTVTSNTASSSKSDKSEKKRNSTASNASFFKDLIHPFQIKWDFFLYSATTFLILTAVGYLAYGYEFLFETYLYHVSRVDTRHNFSVYFYQLYLECSAKFLANTGASLGSTAAAATTTSASLNSLLPFLSFFPQLLILLVFACLFYRDIVFVIFLQTFAFVMWNKVMTAQYFIWWLVPLIAIVPQSSLSWKHGIPLLILWFASEVHWLNWGYQVEFLGRPAFLQMWMAGIVFFLANCVILTAILWNHRIQPVFAGGQLTRINLTAANSDDSERRD